VTFVSEHNVTRLDYTQQHYQHPAVPVTTEADALLLRNVKLFYRIVSYRMEEGLGVYYSPCGLGSVVE